MIFVLSTDVMSPILATVIYADRGVLDLSESIAGHGHVTPPSDIHPDMAVYKVVLYDGHTRLHVVQIYAHHLRVRVCVCVCVCVCVRAGEWASERGGVGARGRAGPAAARRMRISPQM